MMPATLTGSIRVSSAYRAGDGMFRVKLSKAERFLQLVADHAPRG